MTTKKSKRITAFEASEYYQEVKLRLRNFVLRGQEVDLEDLQNNVVNKIYEAESSVQVINLLGYALNKPMAEFDMEAPETEKLLQTGELCFIEEKSRKMLERVVAKMESFWFTLIPLTVVVDPEKPAKTFETVLIKVYKNGETFCNYVDISGRIYDTFEKFLKNNKLPYCILCYPKDGLVSFDQAGDIEITCTEVGFGNSVLNVVDIAVGVVGAVGTVGTIAATGGLAVPFLLVSLGSAGYVTGRGIEKLVDSSKHGMSLNPLKDPEARNNWLMISANMLAFASMGTSMGLAAAAKMESLTATQIARLIQAGRILKGVSASVNMLAVVDSIIYTVNNWSNMTIYEKIALACAVCFCFREVISLVNAERLIRESQIQGMCKFFKGCVNGGIASLDTFITNARGMFVANDEALGTGLKLVRMLIEDKFDVTVKDDCTVISFFGFEYSLGHLIRLEQLQLAKFLYMIQGMALNFKDLFSLLRKSFGDENILAVVSKQGDDLGGHRTDYATALNQLLQVFDIVRRAFVDFNALTETGLIIGNGNRFTIKSAYMLIEVGVTKTIPLLKALVELNMSEAIHLNRLRDKWGEDETVIFQWTTTGSISSSEMVAKLRFLLDVDKICIDRWLKVTELNISTACIEIESIIQIDFQLFYGVDPPIRPFLLDPKFFRVCESAMCCHRQNLKQLWNNTCLLAEPADKSFEKVATLEHVFQRYPFSVEMAVTFAFETQCTNFPQFVSLVLFALNGMERLMRENQIDEVDANGVFFSDMAALKSRYLGCRMKTNELELAGYCPMDCMDSMQLVEAIKKLAAKGSLRFGTVENATLHFDEYPMLRLRSEMSKFNRFISLKKFDREEVQSVGIEGGRQKWLIFLENAHLRIIIGVVGDVGAYIDTFQFSHA